jgi:hypothetical protein
MKLYHPFSEKTRSLFIYFQYCWKCKSNGNGRGGLELHHICGRRKVAINMDSALNASVLCKVCHEHVTHKQNEQLELMLYTWNVLKQERLWQPIEYDIIFLREQCEDEFGKSLPELIKLL